MLGRLTLALGLRRMNFQEWYEKWTAEQPLTVCDVCGRIVPRKEIASCTNCWTHSCDNCSCKCPQTVHSEEEAAFLREENPDGVYLVAGAVAEKLRV